MILQFGLNESRTPVKSVSYAGNRFSGTRIGSRWLVSRTTLDFGWDSESEAPVLYIPI